MRSHVLALTLILLFGCARVKPLPEIPSFQTSGGVECAQHCQKLHSWCISGCVKGENKWARKTCFTQCGEKLADCYDLCLVDDRP
jgi:hypothetical protein